MEKMMTSLIPAMAGANMLYGLGMLESGITIGYGQMLIDNEMAKAVRRCLRGVPVNENSEAVELIKKVGPRGQFMTQKHTRLNMRDHLYPTISNRDSRDKWVASGSQDMGTVADEKARIIIETHKPQALPDQTLADMDKLMKRAEKELAPAA